MMRLGGTTMLASQTTSERLFTALLADPSASRSGRLALVRAVAGLTPDLTPRRGRLLLHTGHGGLEHPAFLAGWRAAGGAVVTFVHDLIPITHPELARQGEAEKHRRRMTSAASHSSAILVNSSATQDELRLFAVNEELPLPPTAVAHLGVSPWAPASARPLDGPYFVVVGTIEARKNHWLLLQLWRRFVEARGSAAPMLVILGQRGWECEHVFDLLDRCEVIRPAVIERSGVSDHELATYVQHSQALLFPSLVEGYGLPLVEALAAGVPVVASDLPVFREIAGDVPQYVDPLDGPAWLARIEALTVHAERVRDFRAPTWRDHFAVVDRLIEGL